jgi:hypothetical protein
MTGARSVRTAASTHASPRFLALPDAYEGVKRVMGIEPMQIALVPLN